MIGREGAVLHWDTLTEKVTRGTSGDPLAVDMSTQVVSSAGEGERVPARGASVSARVHSGACVPGCAWAYGAEALRNQVSLRSGGATASFTQCESLVKTMTTGQEATAQASEMRFPTQQLVLFHTSA